MRYLITIALLLQLSLVPAQDIKRKSFTLQEAVNYGLINNPSLNSGTERRDMVTLLKGQWYQWLYSINRITALQEYYDYMNDVNRVADLQYESGEIDLSTRSSLKLLLADIETKYAITANEKEICENNIRKCMYYDFPVIPTDSVLTMYEIEKFRTYSMDPLPDADTINDYSLFVHDKNIENKELELDNLFIALQYHSSYRIPDAEIALNAARAQYKSEEIDYLAFIQIVTRAFNSKLEYLELINTYNQSAIQLEHEAY